MSSKLRLRFSKKGKAKYISHLDLMATIRRSLLRSGVKLSYSEGFNPHPYMSAALPLPVGCCSDCELMDIELADLLLPDGLPGLISAALPDGIEILDVYAPQRKFAFIAWLGLKGDLYFNKGIPPNALDLMTERLASQSIVISKKTKRGESDIDVAPFIRGPVLKNNGSIGITAKVSAQNPTITVNDMLRALSGNNSGLAPDFTVFTRTEVFDSDMNVFR